MDIIICIEMVSRYLEGEHFERFGDRNIGICDDRGIFDVFNKGIQ